MRREYRNIMVVAGESSGDLHAAALVEALKRRDEGFRFYGVGGEKLRRAGVRLIADASEMAVVGLTEVFAKLPFILKVMGKLKNSLRTEKPEAAILVDYPDFNLALAKTAHKRGVKVFYYISPTIWAWRKNRIRKIKKYVDKMAVILPFEAPLYHQAGVDATFIGHPLMDVIPPPSSKEEARRIIGLQEGITTVSILPGSRPSEVTRLLPVCLEAAEILDRENQLQFVLPLANTLSRQFVEGFIRQHKVKITIVEDNIHEVLSASDLAIVASGTATLEAALMETPTIIIYKVSSLSYILGRIFIKIKHIGLPNIIAGKTIVPELVQAEANPTRIACVAQEILGDKSKTDEMKSELAKLKGKLGTPGVSDRAAQLVFSMLAGN
jgi:lipid-A-disaccharide synthase